MTRKTVLSFEEFLQELQKEFKYLSNGGTSHRQHMAKLSLNVALKARNVSPFLKLDVSNHTVAELMPHLDRYCKEDVAKMLYSVAKDLSMNSNLSEDEKSYVRTKTENLKPLAFVKK